MSEQEQNTIIENLIIALEKRNIPISVSDEDKKRKNILDFAKWVVGIFFMMLSVSFTVNNTIQSNKQEIQNIKEKHKGDIENVIQTLENLVEITKEMKQDIKDNRDGVKKNSIDIAKK